MSLFLRCCSVSWSTIWRRKKQHIWFVFSIVKWYGNAIIKLTYIVGASVLQLPLCLLLFLKVTVKHFKQIVYRFFISTFILMHTAHLSEATFQTTTSIQICECDVCTIFCINSMASCTQNNKWQFYCILCNSYLCRTSQPMQNMLGWYWKSKKDITMWNCYFESAENILWNFSIHSFTSPPFKGLERTSRSISDLSLLYATLFFLFIAAISGFKAQYISACAFYIDLPKHIFPLTNHFMVLYCGKVSRLCKFFFSLPLFFLSSAFVSVPLFLSYVPSKGMLLKFIHWICMP